MGRLSILICDDEVELADELAEYLEAMGWSVRVVTRGPEAELILQAGNRPQCLLTDLRVLDYNGADLIALARRLPAESRPLVIGAMTGHLDDGVTAADLGADAIFFKPIDVDTVSRDLMARVEQAVAG